MEKFGKYVLVYDIQELKECSVVDDGEKIGLIGLGLFHNVNEITFPHVFKYYEPFDNHCWGDYYPCDKAEMAQAIEMEISRIKHRIKECKKVIDFLKS
jgi:hypothetical protein